MPLVNDEARAFLPYPDAEVPNAATGPLSGLTFAVKDLFDVAGYPTGGGNPFVLMRSGIKSRTAPAVQCLLDAGARFVGKVVTDEFAFSINGDNIHFGAPVNGAAPERICGGSSSGSASAVSNRLADFALGTDTGGSVRAPASHCGLYGIRPTHGRISLQSVMDLSPSLDTCGYFTRDACLFGRVGEVLLGPDEHPLPDRIRLLKPVDVWALLTEAVKAAYAGPLVQVANGLRAFNGCASAMYGGAGGTTRGAASAMDYADVEVASEGLDSLYWNFRYLQGREAWSSDGAIIERFKVPMGADVAGRFAWSKAVTDEQVSGAVRLRSRFRAQLATLLGNDGVLVMPTMPDIAPLRSANADVLDNYRASAFHLLCLAGLSGFPQISMPLASREGAPLGLSLLGPAGSDLGLVRLAERI